MHTDRQSYTRPYDATIAWLCRAYDPRRSHAYHKSVPCWVVDVGKRSIIVDGTVFYDIVHQWWRYSCLWRAWNTSRRPTITVVHLQTQCQAIMQYQHSQIIYTDSRWLSLSICNAPHTVYMCINFCLDNLITLLVFYCMMHRTDNGYAAHTLVSCQNS